MSLNARQPALLCSVPESAGPLQRARSQRWYVCVHRGSVWLPRSRFLPIQPTSKKKIKSVVLRIVCVQYLSIIPQTPFGHGEEGGGVVTETMVTRMYLRPYMNGDERASSNAI